MLQQRTGGHAASETGQKSRSCSEIVIDRRVQKTHELLRDALASLMADKPYDSIVVKEILDRANVGRSTFYTHFRSKDDLLVDSIHGMVESVRSTKLRRSAIWHERILWFSLPIFQYHYGHLHNGRLTMGDHARAIQHDRLRHVLAEMIAGSVRDELKSVSPDLVVHYIASTFVLVLDWWLESENPLPPKEIDEIFHALVLPTLLGSLPRR